MIQQVHHRQIDALLNEYGESHTNRTNIVIHGIAVPAIYWVTIALVWLIPVPEVLATMDITFAHILIIPALFYYFRLSGPIGAAMTLLTIAVFLSIDAMYQLGVDILQFSIVLFAVMWILQFVGHHIEGKKPSFFKDLQFLLVGPAWWWVHWLKRLNIPY